MKLTIHERIAKIQNQLECLEARWSESNDEFTVQYNELVVLLNQVIEDLGTPEE